MSVVIIHCHQKREIQLVLPFPLPLFCPLTLHQLWSSLDSSVSPCIALPCRDRTAVLCHFRGRSEEGPGEHQSQDKGCPAGGSAAWQALCWEGEGAGLLAVESQHWEPVVRNTEWHLEKHTVTGTVVQHNLQCFSRHLLLRRTVYFNTASSNFSSGTSMLRIFCCFMYSQNISWN